MQKNLVEETLNSYFEMPSSAYRSSSFAPIDSFIEILEKDLFWKFYPLIVTNLETLINVLLYVMDSQDVNMVHKAVIAFSVLISGGIYPSRHPSKRPTSQQSAYLHEISILLRNKNSEIIRIISCLCHTWLYSGLPIEHFTATSPSGCCLVVALSKLLTQLACDGVVDVISILTSSVENAKFTWKHETWEKWHTVFFVSIQNGVVGLFDYLRSIHPSLLMDDTYPPEYRRENGAFWRCDDEVRYTFAELISVLASGNSIFCQFLINKEAIFANFATSTLSNTKSIEVRNFIFKLISEMFKHIKASHPDHIVPVHSKMNQIRMSLFYERDLLNDVYFAACSSSAFLQSKLGTCPERFVDPYVSSDGTSIIRHHSNDSLSFLPPAVSFEGAVSKTKFKTSSKFSTFTVSKANRFIERQSVEEATVISSNSCWIALDSYLTSKRAIDSLLFNLDCLIL
jgi:hypothetical protein